jgi:hypothetical protein
MGQQTSELTVQAFFKDFSVAPRGKLVAATGVKVILLVLMTWRWTPVTFCGPSIKTLMNKRTI